MIAFISRFTERQSKPKPTYLTSVVQAKRPSVVTMLGILADDATRLSAAGEPQRAARVESKWQALVALGETEGVAVRVRRTPRGSRRAR